MAQYRIDSKFWDGRKLHEAGATITIADDTTPSLGWEPLDAAAAAAMREAERTRPRLLGNGLQAIRPGEDRPRVDKIHPVRRRRL